MTSPARRRQVVTEVRETIAVSERRVWRAIEQPCSSQRYVAQVSERDKPLIKQIIHLAEQYGRYGYRRITALLQNQGWQVKHKRVERILRSEGLKVPQKQPKRGRLWLNDDRLRPERANHGWSYDFVMDATDDGKPFRMFNVIDEFTRECLAIQVARNIKAGDVEACLTELFCSRGILEHIRSDNGSEFTAKSIRKWLNELGVKTLFIEPGSPWENGYIESFNGKLRDELLNGEIFYTLQKAKILIEKWRRECNQVRPHSALGYKPPAPRAVVISPLSASLLQVGAQTLTQKVVQRMGAGHYEQFQWLVAEIQEMGGEAMFWKAQSELASQEDELVLQFINQINVAYQSIINRLAQPQPDLATLAQEYQQVIQRDYLHSQLGQQLHERLLTARGDEL